MNARQIVLVVDDQVTLAENIAEILTGVGHLAETAESAEAALARFARGGIAALITDYRLPGMNGAELIAELRRRGISVPAVVMSAYSDEETVDRSLEAGAVDVFAKPVNLGRMMTVVESLARDEPIVLVVDDHKPLAENLAEALRGHGFQVAVGGGATEALAQPIRPRVAILDCRLPDGSGRSVAERLVARDPRVRLLFVSAHAEELERCAAVEAHRVDTLEKPIDVGRLLAWVAAALEPA